ncbi:MAG: hypothetical protein GY729_07305 [Desulfobacteraceae bacterium]|nr:hypothetical protein [Desulfobacteraceae bacterium]
MAYALDIPELDNFSRKLDLDKETMMDLLYQRSLYVEDINKIHYTAIIGDQATLTGNIKIGPNTVIFYYAMIQADKASIVIGEGCCILDGVLMHNKIKIGDYVHIDHGCLIHQSRPSGCLKIGSGTLIGFGSQVHESIGKGCQVAPGVVVDQPIPDYHYVYEKKLGDGLKKTIVSPMRASNYERVVDKYKRFWDRLIIYKGNLIPLKWNRYDTGNFNYRITFDDGIKKLKSYFNYNY